MSELRMHVLIVEDNADEALALKLAFEGRPEMEITTEWAPTVASAITRLERGGVDAVLLDLTMPDGRGTDVVSRIRAAAPDIHSVVYTGWQKADVEDAAKAAGAAAVVQKPAEPGELITQLRLTVVYRDAVRERKEFSTMLRSIAGTVEELKDAVGDSGTHRFPPVPPGKPEA